MKVINILADGRQVNDLSQINVPVTNAAYDVCKNVFIKRGSNDREGNKDTKEKTDA